MIEAYAFLAMFSVQILLMSVMFPAWLIGRVRRKMPGVAAERYAQLNPDFDYGRAVERFAFRYRLVNWLIVIVGIVLFAWFYNYTQRPDWDDGPIEGLLAAFSILQCLPMVVMAWFQFRLKSKLLTQTAPEARRKAYLQRRGLFDFVSPFTVLLTAVCYVLYAAYVVYIAQHPFPGFAGIGVNIGMFTLMYAAQGFFIYRLLYGRKINQLETNADGIRAIGFGIRASVWVCIAGIVHSSINFTLVLHDLQRWEVLAESAFFVFCGMLCMFALPARPHENDAESPGGGEQLAERNL